MMESTQAPESEPVEADDDAPQPDEPSEPDQEEGEEVAPPADEDDGA